jgi:hypothetical protein
VNFYRNIIFGTLCLMFIIFSGCAPEENDLVPPNAAFDGSVETPTPLTTTPVISGTMDIGSIVEVDVTTGAIVNGLIQDPDAGTWSFFISDMVEGENIILVSVADVVGNTRTIQLSIVVDLTGPLVTLDQYISYTPVPSQTLAGTIGEVNAEIEYCVQWVSNPSCDPALPVWSPVDPADVNGTLWQHPFNFVDVGLYTVMVRGIDNLGNLTDPAAYASVDIIYDSTNAPVFTVNQALQTLPIVMSDGIAALDGTYDNLNFDLVLSTSPVTSLVFDQADPLGSDTWTLDFDNLPAGNTVATFSIQDLTPAEVAQANILIVRDLSGPVLIDTVPVPGATGVNTGTGLTLTFSETMDPATIVNEMIVLTDDQDVQVPFTITLPAVGPLALDREFTFTPDATLVSGTEYSVSVVNPAAQAATDQYGNGLIPPTFIWTFTTAP